MKTCIKHSPLASQRMRLGISIRSLAGLMGCDSSHLSRLERGQATASPALSQKLANFFENKITRDQILFPKDYEKASSPKKLKEPKVKAP